MSYEGPLRDEPIAVELHNTLYVVGGVRHDGLSPAWLEALSDRLPAAGPGPSPGRDEPVALRDSIRSALQAAVLGTPHDATALDAINRASAGAPRSPLVVRRPGRRPRRRRGVPRREPRSHRRRGVRAGCDRPAHGPQAGDLRACGAPGCILLFVKDHPRREWCSNACGNRARQARHYERVRRRG